MEWPKERDVTSEHGWILDYNRGFNQAISQCADAIKSITEEELMEATYNTVTQHDAVMIRSFLLKKVGR